MSSLLVHNINASITKEALEIIIENLAQNIEILDIDISYKFESAIIYFNDIKSATEILENHNNVKIGPATLTIKLYNQINNWLTNNKDAHIVNKKELIENSSKYNYDIQPNYNNFQNTISNASFSNLIDNNIISNRRVNSSNHTSPNNQPLIGINSNYHINHENKNIDPLNTNENQPMEIDNLFDDEGWEHFNENDFEIKNNQATNFSYRKNKLVHGVNHKGYFNQDDSSCNRSILNREIYINKNFKFKREIIFSDSSLSRQTKIKLLKMMIDYGKIKEGFNLVKDGQIFVLSSNVENDLEIYYKELQNIVDHFSSKTDLDVHNNLQESFNTPYGVLWANQIIKNNKLIAEFIASSKTKELIIIGFTREDTEKARNSISESLLVTKIKSNTFNQTYNNVEIINKENSVITIRGLPRYVIKAMQDIATSSKNWLSAILKFLYTMNLHICDDL